MIYLHEQYQRKPITRSFSTEEVKHVLETWRNVKQSDTFKMRFHILNDFVSVFADSIHPEKRQIMTVFKAKRIDLTDTWTVEMAVRKPVSE
jgi:hypothetical protein